MVNRSLKQYRGDLGQYHVTQYMKPTAVKILVGEGRKAMSPDQVLLSLTSDCLQRAPSFFQIIGLFLVPWLSHKGGPLLRLDDQKGYK